MPNRWDAIQKPRGGGGGVAGGGENLEDNHGRYGACASCWVNAQQLVALLLELALAQIVEVRDAASKTEELVEERNGRAEQGQDAYNEDTWKSMKEVTKETRLFLERLLGDAREVVQRSS